MSTIGRKDEVASMKEYYSQRENDIEKKHERAISELKKSQDEDLAVIRTSSRDEVLQAREGMREKLTEQDIKHQKEIDTIRAMYQKKLEEAKREKV